MITFHRHIWGEIKDGYQYCTICNKAILVPSIKCNHVWKDYKELDVMDKGSKTAIIIIRQCKICGELKEHTIEHYMK